MKPTLLFLPFLVLFLPFTANAAPPTVDLPYGTVQGININGTSVFRGIPYAKAPLEDLRFRPPQRADNWSGVRVASVFGPSCLQMGGYPGSPNAAWNTLNVSNGSEDCLFLNVYTNPSALAINSNDSNDDLLPVMVYFHAGEFRFGSANDQENNWPYFAHGSVLLVTANVRLGLLGFGALEALRARDPSGSTGNYGLQDQRAVLHWTQECIRQFGGDPTRVTIFGESSGGSSVAFHTISSKSSGLFHRSILESAGLTQSKNFEQSEGNTQFGASLLTAARSPYCAWAPGQQEFRVLNGLTVLRSTPLATGLSLDACLKKCEALDTCALIANPPKGPCALYGGGQAGSLSSAPISLYNASFKTGTDSGDSVHLRVSDPSTVVQCLVHASAEDLVGINASPPFGDTFDTDASAPTVDGVELITSLAEAVRAAPINPGVRILGGSNLDEGTEFMQLTPTLSCNATQSDFKSWALRQFGTDLGMKIAQAYTPGDLIQPVPLCRSYGHSPVPTSAWWQVAMRAAGDQSIMCRTRDVLQRQADDSYWYHFRATPLFSANMGDLEYMGAFHGAEVPFVFGATFELSSDGERALSNAMGCYWINFAATGNPNTGPTKCFEALKLTNWPVVGPSGDALVLTNTSITSQASLLQAKCALR